MAAVAIGSSSYVTPLRTGVDMPDAHIMHTATNTQTDGFTFENTGTEVIYLTTTAAVPGRTVTIETSATLGGYAVADQVINVAGATESELVGPFPTALFGTTVTVKTTAANETNGVGIRIIRFT